MSRPSESYLKDLKVIKTAIKEQLLDVDKCINTPSNLRDRAVDRKWHGRLRPESITKISKDPRDMEPVANIHPLFREP